MVDEPMRDQDKSRVQLVEEVESLRQQVAKLKKLDSQRRLHAEAMRDTDAEFRDLYDAAPVGYVEMDIEARITRVNHPVLTMLGYTAEEMLGRPIWEFVVEREAAQEAIAARIQQMQPVTAVERTYVRKDGTILSASIENRLRRDSSGRVVGLRSTIQDISARKRMEEQLRRSEEKYRRIFENVRDVFYQTDLQGRITEISPSIQRYSFYAREELLGKQVEELYLIPEERQRLLKEITEHGEVADFEVRLKNKAGQVAYVSVNAHFLLDQDGKPKGTEGSLRAITVRKCAEEELREALVLEQRYEVARRMLQVLIHEVANPLTGILGNLSLLKTEQASSQVHDSLKEIEQCALRIDSALRQLTKLDLASPRAITGGGETKR